MPNLIEPGIKYFLSETLKNCNKKEPNTITICLIYYCF